MRHRQQAFDKRDVHIILCYSVILMTSLPLMLAGTFNCIIMFNCKYSLLVPFIDLFFIHESVLYLFIINFYETL